MQGEGHTYLTLTAAASSRQRSLKVDPSLIIALGRLAYGADWQSPLAACLGMDRTAVARWTVKGTSGNDISPVGLSALIMRVILAPRIAGRMGIPAIEADIEREDAIGETVARIRAGLAAESLRVPVAPDLTVAAVIGRATGAASYDLRGDAEEIGERMARAERDEAAEHAREHLDALRRAEEDETEKPDMEQDIRDFVGNGTLDWKAQARALGFLDYLAREAEEHVREAYIATMTEMVEEGVRRLRKGC